MMQSPPCGHAYYPVHQHHSGKGCALTRWRHPFSFIIKLTLPRLQLQCRRKLLGRFLSLQALSAVRHLPWLIVDYGLEKLNEREAHEHWSFLTIQSEDPFSTHQLTKLNNDSFEGS